MALEAGLPKTGGHAAGGLASYRLRQRETALPTRDASAILRTTRDSELT